MVLKHFILSLFIAFIYPTYSCVHSTVLCDIFLSVVLFYSDSSLSSWQVCCCGCFCNFSCDMRCHCAKYSINIINKNMVRRFENLVEPLSTESPVY